MDRTPVVNIHVNASQSIEICIPDNLPNPAMYGIVLDVKDVANNVKHARRFVMFDNSSVILARDGNPLHSTTAAASTGYKWQTNHGDLCYSWKDRYHNDKLKVLLRPIKPDYHGHFTGIYEQISGILPVSGTENVDGITEFYFSLSNDTSILFVNETVRNVTTQKICLSLPLQDGETYRFDIVAKDIMNHTFSEHVYTHVDSSEPEIFDIGLEKDGYKLLNVHNSSDLSKMILKFNALDIHSGLYSVDWSLGTSFGGHDIGNGSLGIARLGPNDICPEHSNCYCPSVGVCAYYNFSLSLNSLVHLNTHNGNHNRVYHFTLSVTNDARLSFVEHKEVLADDSPPAVGVVSEGSVVGEDIDYTSEETVTVNWDGFIDHESGIHSYKVGVGNSCLDKDAFGGINNSDVTLHDETSIITTTFQSARVTLAAEGQYFVTVVAYNNAMESSDPVCSDGIVLDKTPPLITNVTLKSATSTECMVCSEGTAWYITRNLTKYKVSDGHCDELCRNTTVNEFLSLLPVEGLQPSQTKPCFISDGHGTIYLPIDLIDLQWDVIDTGSQIRDVYIGVGSTEDSSLSPDLIDYHKSSHTDYYKSRHVGLSDGDEIYIFVKITNSAVLTSTATIGPVIVDETPPVCPTSLPVLIQNGSLYIYWSEGAIADEEQKEPISTFLYRVDKESTCRCSSKMDDPDADTCVVKGQICLNIPLPELHVYDSDFQLTFTIQLHVFNHAGYHCTVNTDNFRLPSQNPPGHGRQGEYVSLFKQMDDPDADTCVVKGQICLNIPLPELHVYDSDFQLTFTIQLHVFNHAGYHCTVNTDNFRLPSQNPPGHGVVYDVIRNDGAYVDGRQDIDVSVSLEEFCVTWEGFSHVGDMTHELGMGEVPGTDDTIPFHEVPDRKLYCENATNLSHYRRYFVTVRAITSGGSTDAISDGFTIINPRHVMTSLRVFDGNGCTGKIGTPVERKFGTVNIYTPSKINLHIGHTYSLVSNASLTIASAEAIVTVHTTIDLVNYYQFLPLTAKPQFNVASDTNRSFSLHILNCVSDADSQISRDIASLYWDQGKLSSYVSHFEVEFLSLAEGTGEPLVIDFTTVSGHLNSFSFGTVNLVKGRYFFALRQCVEYTCFDWVKTNGFALIDHFYESFSMSSWMNRTGPECSDIQLTIADLQCSNSISRGMDKSVAIRWGIFRDKDLKIQLTDWNLYIIESNSTTVELSTCQKLSLHPHVKMQTCVEVFCPEGSMGSRCGPLIVTEDPNVFDKHQLYEVDSDSDDIRHNTELFYASNIGDKLAWLHGSEIDFTGKSFRPGGVILGMGDRAITWYLLRNKYNFTQPCEVNPDCVATVETVGGLSAFQGINLDVEIVYYICAVTTIVEDGIPSVQTCGNGFVVDITPPVVGDVIFTSDNGFITQASSLIIHWDGFQDFDGYRTLGYPSSIARFYIFRSNPYAQDVVPETDVGLYHSARVQNPTLTPGVTYYVTVTAFDHVGHHTTAVSNGVMFDNTPPVTGTISVGTYLKQSDIVSEEITVHWTGVRDNESGISKTRLGVGSSKHQPDVIDYRDCSGEFTSLSDLETLHDGHRYYVILLPHSGIKYYSAGLGTSPLLDDVKPLSFTGTKTESQWISNFIPGMTYYCTVQACNGAGLCTSVSSNGFITDNSPPLPGIVHVGIDGHHSRFWPHSDSIQMQWFGFVDVESKIQNYEVCVRHTNNSDCDILTFTNVFLSNTVTLPVTLSERVSLSVEVRANNPLDMSTRSVSDTFIVDTTPPVVLSPPVLGRENTNTNVTVQIDPTVVMMNWKFEDQDSPIVKQIIRMRAHADGHTPIENVYLSGETSHIITLDPKHPLRPLVILTLLLWTACNEAGLCTSSTSNGLLIDPTPPQDHRTYTMAPHSCDAAFAIRIAHVLFISEKVSLVEVDVDCTESNYTDDFDMNINIQHDGKYNDQEVLTSSACISAAWTVSGTQKHVIKRMEWSMGQQGMAVGTGIFDPLLENLWYDADIDFQPNTTHTGCHWSGFSDPHSGIKYYSAGLGTSPLLDDVKPLSFTGTKTESQWISNFIPGMTYYCTVQACNGAGLCTSVSSNGFITDNSPPLPGIVHVGIDGHHSRFWPHSDSIQMQWFGFVDVESKIQNYEVCVRHTNNSDCDILTFTNVFLSNTVTLPVTLSERVSLSVEVRANNPLDMSTRSVSDTFIVDTTPPVVLSPPVLGRENTNTNVTVQIDPTVVMMNWKFEDQDSPIVKQIIRMRAHADGHTPIENVYLSGETSHIITLDPKHPLRPGDTYTAVVTACNEAGLCTSSTSNGLLIDPTPPHQGGIIEPIPWHLSPNPNETKSFVNLTLYGFKDLESEIRTYYVTVGNTYSGSEISDGILTFISSESDDESEKFQLTLNGRLHSGQQMVLSVWADNNAGLFSSIGRVTVTVIASDNKNTFGYLEILKHSCDAAYCNKDCTCAVISQKCHSVEVDVDCTESNYTDDFDMNINIQHDGKYNDQEVLTSSACISAAWTVSGTQKHVIKRMEWSMGQQGMAVGTGIFDPLLENLWYDVGQKTSVTYCLRGGKSLLHDTKYVVYVRSWTSTSHYTVFTSHPVHIDNTAPSVRRGKYIIENSNKTCSRDVDFTSTLATISSCWTGVFTDPQSGIHSYQVALGTIPGGDDLVSNMNIGLNTLMSWSDLSLSPGTKYYVTVTCINNVGIQQKLVSDGFVVDNEHPYAGIVYNTDRYHNAHVHNSRDIGVSFRGFHDRHSAITRFSVAYEILDQGLVKDNIGLEFADIGFQTSFVFYNTSLVTGQWFRFAVKAKDSAGFESNIVYSPPALLDSTPPVHVKISSVSEVDNITSVNGTVCWTKYLGHPGPTVYKLYIALSNMTSLNEFEVSFENKKQIHSVSSEIGGIYSAAISLVTSPFYDGNRSLSVLAYDIPINTTVDVTLSVSDNITETGLTDDVVAVHQVSLTELNINTDIMDLESGMREIYVGAGTSKGGFQLHPLKRVPASYNILLPVEAPHGQAVHVTVTAVNQAGTWSHFYSSSLLMDHTPPSIANASMSITYKDFGDRILTKVKVRWEVIEDESSEVACSCEISKNKATRMLHYGNSETELETPFLLIDHGTDISARITCFNIANLQESTLVGPETVTLFAPNVSDARISFDTALATSSGLPVIQSSSGVMFSWEIPHDTSGINGNSYRIRRGANILTQWENTELRNYASLDYVLPDQDGIYTVEIQACGQDNMFCQLVNGTFLIARTPPTLTGLSPSLSRLGDAIVLTWNGVFNVHAELLPRYTVTVGTDLGFSDLVRLVQTTDRHVTFKDFKGSDAYVTITCSYVTGLFTNFVDKVTMV
ncbi:uncharacterized protein [Argopecten irradians]|uniref:uncharacterized protein n=1 Tax=Argopecten irradians TaxID=31199 RepID=UPI0037143BD0